MSDNATQYYYPFFNQYVKVPKLVVDYVLLTYSLESENVQHCIGLIIVNLLAFNVIAYSRRKEHYTAKRTKHYTYTNMLRAVEITSQDGLSIKVLTGYRNKGYEKGISSILSAGSRLEKINISNEFELDLESLPLLIIDDIPVFENDKLLAIKNRIKRQSRSLRSKLKRLYEESLRLNRDYWNKIDIDTSNIDTKNKCFNRVSLTREFKDGEMGRWFQKGEMSYQQLSEEERTKLRINGEKVVEIDYSAMHPHILYAWENKQCPSDCYESIMNQCACSRFVAKSMVLIAVNADCYANVSRAVNNKKRETERANRNRTIPEPVLYNELKKQNLTLKQVVEAIKIAHPTIEKYIYSASANKLMLVESDIMTSVLLKLMSLGISALPVHDSVIVPSRNEDVARRVMQDTYMEHTGFKITIK